MVRAAINGFGRIGRLSFRVITTKHQDQIELVAINTSGSMDVYGWAHLAKYDTSYGIFGKDIKVEEVRKPEEATDEDPLIGYFVVDDKRIAILAQENPEKLPWKSFNVDVVIESTGRFVSENDAKKHAKAGARRVIISAPSKGGNVGTYVIGVNEDELGKAKDATVISNASCTTNCVAPVAAVLQAEFGIEKAAMTTIHGYTDDQRLQDNSHHDLRRARAAAENIIPASTGAAIATTETIPELKGLFDGCSLRVPVVTGSITDFAFVLKRDVTVDEVNSAFRDAAENNAIYKGILAVSDEPIVSSDIVGRSESAIVDLPLTQVVAGNLVKVFAWYDNEWGYTNRLVEQIVRVGNTLGSETAPSDPISLTFGDESK